MERAAVLTAFDQQVRRQVAGRPDREVDQGVVRSVPTGPGWAGVTWADLDDASADAVIQAQIERFAALGRSWEWKHYSYDQPADLPDRLRAAGFTAEPPEALMVAEIAELDREVKPPAGVELAAVDDSRGLDALVAVHNQVFGGDFSDLGAALEADLAREPRAAEGVVAYADGVPVSAARVEFNEGTDFAGLWGGGTVAEWRGRGIFRALVARRAGLAAARGFRYLQVDASPDSRPVLRRLGFAELATTTPFVRSA